MRTLVYFSTVLFTFALSYTPYSYADEVVATMANIVISLKHFPSESDKASLATIAQSDDRNAVKAIASAIANISHKVTDADKAVLDAIIADSSTPEDLRDLAVVVSGLTHLPSADAVAVLEGLANP
jgi:hypothetical protein